MLLNVRSLLFEVRLEGCRRLGEMNWPFYDTTVIRIACGSYSDCLKLVLQKADTWNQNGESFMSRRSVWCDRVPATVAPLELTMRHTVMECWGQIKDIRVMSSKDYFGVRSQLLGGVMVLGQNLCL